MAFFLEPILWFMAILGLFKCKFIICKPIFGVPISPESKTIVSFITCQCFEMESRTQYLLKLQSLTPPNSDRHNWSLLFYRVLLCFQIYLQLWLLKCFCRHKTALNRTPYVGRSCQRSEDFSRDFLRQVKKRSVSFSESQFNKSCLWLLNQKVGQFRNYG